MTRNIPLICLLEDLPLIVAPRATFESTNTSCLEFHSGGDLPSLLKSVLMTDIS